MPLEPSLTSLASLAQVARNLKTARMYGGVDKVPDGGQAIATPTVVPTAVAFRVEVAGDVRVNKVQGRRSPTIVKVARTQSANIPVG